MREFPKLLKLETVDVIGYKSRQGGAVKLKFERDRFAYIHMATEEIYNLWKERIGRFYWVQGSWQMGYEPGITYRHYVVRES